MFDDVEFELARIEKLSGLVAAVEEKLAGWGNQSLIDANAVINFLLDLRTQLLDG